MSLPVTPSNNELILDVTVERWRITQDRLGRTRGYRYGEPWPLTYPGGGEVNNCEMALAREVASLRISLLWVAAAMLRKEEKAVDVCLNCGGVYTDEWCRVNQKTCCPERKTLKEFACPTK